MFRLLSVAQIHPLEYEQKTKQVSVIQKKLFHDKSFDDLEFRIISGISGKKSRKIWVKTSNTPSSDCWAVSYLSEFPACLIKRVLSTEASFTHLGVTGLDTQVHHALRLIFPNFVCILLYICTVVLLNPLLVLSKDTLLFLIPFEI